MTIEMCGYLERKDKTKRVPLYRLDNGKMSVTVSAYGGYFTSIIVPDNRGIPGDIALGFSSLDAYEHTAFAPCGIVGRYANRIKDGRFSMNDKTVQVSQNDFPHHLHGGFGGFHRTLWDSFITTDKYGTQYLYLHHVSPDGDEGFPGTLDTSVFITLTDSNELCIHFLAISDKDTVCSLSNHMAVNLDTCRAESIADHELTVYSDTFTPADERGIPTGQILPVSDTPLDFRHSRNLGEQLALSSPYTSCLGGIDHNWFLRPGSERIHPAFSLYHPKSGRKMECLTTMPCVHIYTANTLSGQETGKYDTVYRKHGAFFTETQYAPDSVNHPEWSQPLLKAGAQYDHLTIYRF